jgi:heme-degrading monooxygenase HmoA
MHARLSRWAGLDPERLEQTVQEFESQSLPLLGQQEGFKGVVVMTDANGGKAAAITLWETHDDLRRTEKMAEEMRTRAEQTARAEREPIVDHYEVVLQQL